MPTLANDAAAAPPPRNFKMQMRDQLASIENAVRDCAKTHAAKKLSGRAVLFAIAGRDVQRVVSIESTGSVDDESTVHDEALLTCLHVAGLGMGPFELEDIVDSAVIHWRVELTTGEVTDIKSSDYSFRKDTDGPFD